MTRPRFIGVVHHPAGGGQDLVGRILDCTGPGKALRLALNDAQMTLAVAGPTPLRVGRSGVILGTLVRAGSSQAMKTLRVADCHDVSSTRGRHLIDSFWGPYVAVLPNLRGHGVDVLRAPLGELPCLFTRVAGAVVFASDVDLLAYCGCLPATIDQAALGHELAARAIKRPDTCLKHLSDLPGGDRLSIRAEGIAVDTLWSPWSFTRRDSQFDDGVEAARAVRSSIAACVRARAGAFEQIVLTLSGGLDSSIVAAILAATATPFSCLNLVTPGAGGDERRYARAVAARLGATLIERDCDSRSVDITLSAAARLPRPSARLFNQDYDRAAAEVIGSTGLGAVFNGGGGDNVFCSLQSAAPAADRLLTTGFDRRFWKTAADISRLAPTSLWHVTRAAIYRAWFRGPAFTPPCDTHLLSKITTHAVRRAPPHPWLAAPRNALPGQATHIALLTFAQSYVENMDPQAALIHVAPLLSQPVVELCLRVPTWLWFEQGQNRMVARRAFAPDLPPAVVDRRSKGSPDSFSAAIFEAHRARLRGFLLDGYLAGHGLIDCDATRHVLDAAGPLRGEDFHRLLHFADVEAWARSWSALA